MRLISHTRIMSTGVVSPTFNSSATKYEAILAEQRAQPMTKDSAVLAFKVLDQLIPNMGIFHKLTQMCRDQLYDAVFSDRFTGSAQGDDHFVGRLTYFELVQRVKCSDEEKLDEMNRQLEVVKKMIFDKQKQYEDVQDKAEQLKDKIFEFESTIMELEDTVSEKKLDLWRLKGVLQDERKRNEGKEHDLEYNMAEFKEELQEAQSDVNFLNLFKRGYDDLHQAFVQKKSFAEEDDVKELKNPLGTIATKRAYLISSATNANKLELQLLTVQNATVEEFDNFLEAHKRELTKKDGVNDEDLANQLDIADQQLALTQERFRHTTADLNCELALLRQHRNMLLEQLQTLEESQKESATSRAETQGSTNISAPLNVSDDDDDVEAMFSDPFIPQERVFCKYAAMLYTSTQEGKTFHEFTEAAYCPSCGEKTVLCPHKILGPEEVFNLPVGTTCIKIARPKVRLNHDIIGPILAANGSLGLRNESGSLLGASRSFSHDRSFSVDMLSGHASTNRQESATSDGHEPGDMEIAACHLLDDYSSRTSLERKVTRALPIDMLYQFMAERYMNEDIGFLATHDLFTAIGEHSTSNRLIWLLGQVLAGYQDGVAFRYVLLLGDFIERVEWRHVDDFRAFARVIYPFLDEEDLETLQIGYTSFSENKISRTLVSEYVIYCIMKNCEPLFVETEWKISQQSVRGVTEMTEEEFIEASDAVLSVMNHALRSALYRQAGADVNAQTGRADAVPLKRLAQITSYLSLLHLSNSIKARVSERVATAHKDSMTVSPHSSHAIKSDSYRLMTMCDAKTLAATMAKRDLCRQMRRQMFDDDEDY